MHVGGGPRRHLGTCSHLGGAEKEEGGIGRVHRPWNLSASSWTPLASQCEPSTGSMWLAGAAETRGHWLESWSRAEFAGVRPGLASAHGGVRPAGPPECQRTAECDLRDRLNVSARRSATRAGFSGGAMRFIYQVLLLSLFQGLSKPVAFRRLLPALRSHSAAI